MQLTDGPERYVGRCKRSAYGVEMVCCDQNASHRFCLTCTQGVCAFDYSMHSCHQMNTSAVLG